MTTQELAAAYATAMATDYANGKIMQKCILVALLQKPKSQIAHFVMELASHYPEVVTRGSLVPIINRLMSLELWIKKIQKWNPVLADEPKA